MNILKILFNYKSIKILLLLLIFLNVQAFAIEEIKLETENQSLFKYLSDVYYGNVEEYESVSPVLKLFSEKGLEFKNSPINSLKVGYIHENRFTYTFNENQTPSAVHKFFSVEPIVGMKFNENKSEILFNYNILRDLPGYDNKFSEKITRLYVSHSINPNQTILIGQGRRIPVNYNGSLAPIQLDMVLKSQLGRTLGDAYAVGVRNIGTYEYLDYDIGIYDSTRYMNSFGHGSDFTGYVMLKPFGNNNEKYGKLRIGGSYNIGKYYNSYNQYSFFTGYDYNKVHFRAEYANADGYNGIAHSNNHADGFYTTFIYDLFPKVSIVGRYDYFNPDKDSVYSNIQEYTAGITYFPFKNMKILLNFVRRNYSDKPDSNMILFATRFIIW